MSDESDYYPSPIPIPPTATAAEYIAALNQVRDAVHQARLSRHAHQSRVAGIVSGIQADMMEATDRYAKELATVTASIVALQTALSGSGLGATGINAQISANNAQISSLVSQVSLLTAAVHDCREDSERRYVAMEPLIAAHKSAAQAAPWWRHPVAISCMCALSISALAKAGPLLGAIVQGIK
jgi:maleate cis-trans isomerase